MKSVKKKKKLTSLVMVPSLLAVLVAGANATASPSTNSQRALDLGRQILPANNGWAAYSTGTTGGSTAASDHIYTVTNRSELIKALSPNPSQSPDITPKIVYIQGTIDMNVDDNNQPLADPEGFYSAGTNYSLADYLAEYQPVTSASQEDASKYIYKSITDTNGNVKYYPIPSASYVTKTLPGHPQEYYRALAAKNQQNRILIKVGSNTTIIGLGNDAKIVGGNLYISNADNVIVRNIEFQDAYDYFPAWDPTDGSLGNWNSNYDNISIRNSTHVWIDHNTINDGAHPDISEEASALNPTFFNRQYQHHDGAVDITNAADYVTVSYNYFHDHDKTSLVGGSDGETVTVNGVKQSPGYHVTFDHNLYQNTVQRLPRVRFGQVHIYNNYYIGEGEGNYPFHYAWGVGINSKIYAQNNYFQLPAGFDPAKIIGGYKGTSIYAEGTMINSHSQASNFDAVAAYNSENPSAPLSTDVGWTPALFDQIDPTQSVPGLVTAKAGAGKLQ